MVLEGTGEDERLHGTMPADGMESPDRGVSPERSLEPQPLGSRPAPNEPAAHRPAAVLSLKQAMRRARFDDAERSGAVADLRLARLGRLDVLHEALKPLIAQIPADVDCFDVGIMPGANPRLFIDMIGFVEMGRDPRVYRFLQDTRHGRITLAESEAVDTIVEAATHYVARRLLERDKALASDSDDDPVRRPLRGAETRRDRYEPVRPGEAAPAPEAQGSGDPTGGRAPRSRAAVGILSTVFAFLIDVLGSIAFFSLLAFAGWVIWSNFKS